jgi:hypothetical protein
MASNLEELQLWRPHNIVIDFCLRVIESISSILKVHYVVLEDHHYLETHGAQRSP